MYSSSLRTTYGLTLRGPASRLKRVSGSGSSRMGVTTGTFGAASSVLGAAVAGRLGRCTTAAAAGRGAVLRGAGLAFAAARTGVFAGAETVFLALLAFADGFLAAITCSGGS